MHAINLFLSVLEVLLFLKKKKVPFDIGDFQTAMYKAAGKIYDPGFFNEGAGRLMDGLYYVKLIRCTEQSVRIDGSHFEIDQAQLDLFIKKLEILIAPLKS